MKKLCLFHIILFLLALTVTAQTNGSANNSCVKDKCWVRLNVEFLDSGKIGDVSIVSNGCSEPSLADRAFDAAKKIIFEPKVIDGKPVRTVKQVEYSFECLEGSAKAHDDDKAAAIVAKAVQNLGGDRYLHVTSQIGRGKYSVIKEGGVASFQTFIDVIVFPDKERAEFRGGGDRTVQANSGSTGWVYDGAQDLIKVQNEGQVANFKQTIRTSLDNLLRGSWKNEAELSYVGRRAATLGKRNDVVKLTYKDGFTVEFEFAADDALPQKALYKRTNSAGEETKEEDHYAQFIDIGGIKTPYIIDRFSDGKPSSRINYESVEYNRSIPDSIFTKPANAKVLKKDLKL